MPVIYEYLEYRQYLKDYYEHRKSIDPYFTYRYMASRVDLHSSHLIRIFQQKRHIVESSIPAFIKLCRLDEKEAEFFASLVAYNKARSDRLAKAAFEKLLAVTSVPVHGLTREQYSLFENWYVGIIRVLVSITPFTGNFRELAARLSPPISVAQAKKAIRVLEALQLIEKSSDNTYRLTDQFISTGEKWKTFAVRTFQKETMTLAMESLERHDKDERDISTVTIPVAKKDLPILKERITEFRKSLLRMVRDSENYDEVYQLNIQFFPVTKRKRPS